MTRSCYLEILLYSLDFADKLMIISYLCDKANNSHDSLTLKHISKFEKLSFVRHRKSELNFPKPNWTLNLFSRAFTVNKLPTLN